MEEKEIIKLCKEKDEGAYKMIYQKYEQTLLRTAFRMLGNRQDAEDAVQQTFLKLYRGINGFSFLSKFSTYLFKILINTCYDILRKKKKTDTEPLSESESNYSSQSELQLSLEKAIEQLPGQMRACFVLFAVEGFKQREIAKILTISIGGVKSNIFHAKFRLRKTLSPYVKEVI